MPVECDMCSSMEKGPDMHPEDVSLRSSFLMMLGRKLADARFFGMKVCKRGSGLPIGELKVMSWTRLGNEEVRFASAKACFQAAGT